MLKEIKSISFKAFFQILYIAICISCIIYKYKIKFKLTMVTGCHLYVLSGVVGGPTTKDPVDSSATVIASVTLLMTSLVVSLL